MIYCQRVATRLLAGRAGSPRAWETTCAFNAQVGSQALELGMLLRLLIKSSCVLLGLLGEGLIMLLPEIGNESPQEADYSGMFGNVSNKLDHNWHVW